jgi:hypothetical protein
LIYNYYDDLGITFSNIEKLGFTKNEILLLNYIQYYNQQTIFTLDDFYTSGFKVNKLLRKIMYIVDYDNNNELNTLFSNTDYTFYNRTTPFLYYNEIDYTNLNQLKYNYNQLNQVFTNYLPINNNIIDVPSTQEFYFYDEINSVLIQYNKFFVSANGWITLYNNSQTLCTIRFFPYHLLPNEINRFVQYNYNDAGLIEINMQINTNTNNYKLIIHINNNGLFTFYSVDQIPTLNLLYSSPDPTMDTSSLYYILPMYYTIHADKSINSFFYKIMRFNFDYLYDGFIGYTPKELLNVGYSFQNLLDASMNSISLRNLNYDALTLKNNGYSIDSIIYSYNSTYLDLSNMGFTLTDMKYYLKKIDYQNNNISVEQLYNIGYSIDDFIWSDYLPTDIIGLNFTLLDYLNSYLFLNPNYLDYLNNNIFTVNALIQLYPLFLNNYDNYKNEIKKIFNLYSIENIYDSLFYISFPDFLIKR